MYALIVYLRKNLAHNFKVVKIECDIIWCVCRLQQVPFTAAITKQIENECRDFVQLSESLANLEIAIGFLQSVGGQPESSLVEFMTKTLSMEEPVSCSQKVI